MKNETKNENPTGIDITVIVNRSGSMQSIQRFSSSLGTRFICLNASHCIFGNSQCIPEKASKMEMKYLASLT